MPIMKNNMMEMTRKKDILREGKREIERGKKIRLI
jgi:hypothetical protein